MFFFLINFRKQAITCGKLHNRSVIAHRCLFYQVTGQILNIEILAESLTKKQ